MIPKHCLDCDKLTINTTRCLYCDRKHANALSAAGRNRRGKTWPKLSANIRRYWETQGRTCVDYADGKCYGRIQADHLAPGSSILGYAPRCLYHNNLKGKKWY